MEVVGSNPDSFQVPNKLFWFHPLTYLMWYNFFDVTVFIGPRYKWRDSKPIQYKVNGTDERIGQRPGLAPVTLRMT